MALTGSDDEGKPRPCSVAGEPGQSGQRGIPLARLQPRQMQPLPPGVGKTKAVDREAGGATLDLTARDRGGLDAVPWRAMMRWLGVV